MFSHLSSIIPTPETPVKKVEPSKYKKTMGNLFSFKQEPVLEEKVQQKPPNTKPVLEPSLQVKKIFFSKNE